MYKFANDFQKEEFMNEVAKVMLKIADQHDKTQSERYRKYLEGHIHSLNNVLKMFGLKTSILELPESYNLTYIITK